jgi:hypothetical protein
MSRSINQLPNVRLTPRPTSAGVVAGGLHTVDFGGDYATKPARCNRGEASGP